MGRAGRDVPGSRLPGRGLDRRVDLADPVEITVGLAATDTQGETRQLDYAQPVVAARTSSARDAGRLAAFVLHAWVRQQAAGGSEFFTRVNDHLFPMIGDPPDPIQPFPLVQPMKAVPDFAPWQDSVLSTADGASGALTFLWHLRALLTGVESTDFLSGSMFFPLAAAPPSPEPADAGRRDRDVHPSDGHHRCLGSAC